MLRADGVLVVVARGLVLVARLLRPSLVRWEDSDREPKPVTLRLLPNAAAEVDREILLTMADPTVDGAARVALPSNGNIVTAFSHAVRITLSAAGSAGPGETATVYSANAQPIGFATSAGRFAALSAVEAPAQAPTGYPFPTGFFSFAIDSLVQGQTVTVTLTLPPGTHPDAYIKCTSTRCAAFAGAASKATW